MTSKRLKLHQETQDAITGLKEGHLSEADFWKAIQKSDMGSLWKNTSGQGANHQKPKRHGNKWVGLVFLPYDFTDSPGWQLKSFQGLKESPCTNHTLFTIPGGLPEYRACLDVLHTLDLGVTVRLAGSILHAWTLPPGSKKKDVPGNAAKIWAMLKEAYAELDIEESTTTWWCPCFVQQRSHFPNQPS